MSEQLTRQAETRSVDGESIDVLVVDDDPQYADLTGDVLSSQEMPFEVRTETDPSAVLERVESGGVDCIVCDYDMPGMNGLDVLEEVRTANPDLPFILFTGKGSEEIASEAISAGVTDYLQKSGGTDQYDVLANRIDNAVAGFRAERVLEEVREFQKLIKHSTDVISVVDPSGTFQYLAPSAERVLGYAPEELVGQVGFDYIHPDDRQEAMEAFGMSAASTGELVDVEFRFDHPDGWVWLESRARNMQDDPDIDGFVVYSRNITERKERERQNERLRQFASEVSHDLRNPLGVAAGRLDLLEETGDMSHVEHVRTAHERMNSIIEELLTLAKQGEYIENRSTNHLPEAAREAWSNVATGDAELVLDGDRQVSADPGRLQQLLENLFANAVEHGSTGNRTESGNVAERSSAGHRMESDDTVEHSSTSPRSQARGDAAEHGGSGVTVIVGPLPDGFHVTDDGQGLPEAAVGQAFESGFTTAEDGIGFGLTIVEEVANAHGWSVTAAEGPDGGARFEVTGLEEG